MGRPDAKVWCIDGDGSFQMTLHELATIVQEKLAVKIAIINNGSWDCRDNGRIYCTENVSLPHAVWAGLCETSDAYGIPGLKVRRKEEVIPAIAKAIAHDGPFLIDFGIDPEENVYPFVPPGASLEEFLETPNLEMPKKEDALWQRQSTR